MESPQFKRLPKHIGVIPDGNRRWAELKGLPKEAGYEKGIEPGLQLYELCLKFGIKELTFYGFTQDNTKRPAIQRKAFQKACVESVMRLAEKDAALLVVGNGESPMFPRELKPFLNRRVKFGNGLIRVNFLVNYGWNWDLSHPWHNGGSPKDVTCRNSIIKKLASSQISRIDLILRWGGRRRLSGFLPAQSVYSDFYILEELWPDFEWTQFLRALNWYQEQDVTLGG